MSFPIICLSCGTTGSVGRVTANLQCKCGSTDLDIWDGQEKTAASPGTGWNQKRPDPDANWSDYVGPPAGRNPKIDQKLDADANHVCPACGGTGHDSRASGGGYEENVCRNCRGTGKVDYTTENDAKSLDAHVPNGPPLGAHAVKVAIPTDKGGKLVSATKGDKLVAMAAKIVEVNSGLSSYEAFELARRAVEAFPEGN